MANSSTRTPKSFANVKCPISWTRIRTARMTKKARMPRMAVKEGSLGGGNQALGSLAGPCVRSQYIVKSWFRTRGVPLEHALDDAGNIGEADRLTKEGINC